MKRTELIELRNKLNNALGVIRPLEGEILNATDMDDRMANKANMAFDKILSAMEKVDDLLDRMNDFKADFLEVMAECSYQEDAYTGDTEEDYKLVQYVLELHENNGEGTIYAKEDNPNFNDEVKSLKRFLRRWKTFCGVVDE